MLPLSTKLFQWNVSSQHAAPAGKHCPEVVKKLLVQEISGGAQGSESWQSKGVERQLTVPLGLFCLPVMMSYLATPCILSEAATAGS